MHIGSRCFRAAGRSQPHRRAATQIRAQEKPEQKKGKGLFGFVTDNPSSQNVRPPRHASVCMQWRFAAAAAVPVRVSMLDSHA